MRPFIFVAFALALCGCSSTEEYPVSGTVTLNDAPLAGASVNFYPEGETQGLGGNAVTGADGKYQLKVARGAGLAPGKYRVTVSRRLNPDGSPADPNVPPMESPARETLPAMYSGRDASKLAATIARGQTTHDFALKAKK